MQSGQGMSFTVYSITTAPKRSPPQKRADPRRRRFDHGIDFKKACISDVPLKKL
jgi:hypothetical protein